MNRTERNSIASGNGSTTAIVADVIALCADQLKAANDEASTDVDALTATFLAAVCHDDPAGEGTLPSFQEMLQSVVMDAIARLQFADRLKQRLANVCRNLQASADFLRSGDAPASDAELTDFLEAIRASFSMEHERNMFDTTFTIVNGECEPVAPDAGDD